MLLVSLHLFEVLQKNTGLVKVADELFSLFRNSYLMYSLAGC